MGMGLVGAALVPHLTTPPPPLHTHTFIFGPIRAPHRAKKNRSRALLLSWKVDEWNTHQLIDHYPPL